jgi:hypothetical protein
MSIESEFGKAKSEGALMLCKSHAPSECCACIIYYTVRSTLEKLLKRLVYFEACTYNIFVSFLYIYLVRRSGVVCVKKPRDDDGTEQQNRISSVSR